MDALLARGEEDRPTARNRLSKLLRHHLELTGKRGHYDWIIASHVIEHTPDLIAFLASCEEVLKDDGVLCLVVPDKRFCFDRFRPVTGLARVIDAHLAGQRIHSAGVCAEYFLNVVGKGHELAWHPGFPGDYHLIHGIEDAKTGIREVVEKGSYLDVHDWCFVPHSFRLILEDLHALGYTGLREVAFHPTEGNEFYVVLGKRGKGLGMSRIDVLNRIEREIAALTGIPHLMGRVVHAIWYRLCLYAGKARRLLSGRFG